MEEYHFGILPLLDGGDPVAAGRGRVDWGSSAGDQDPSPERLMLKR
jgi:hypothetical protein